MKHFFFSLGLAYKVKLINDDKNRILMQVTKHRHQQQISKLNGVLEGEEKERKRIAEELHDGVAGDLTAIKFNLLALNSEEMKPKNSSIIKEITEIIDNSCLQIRELSHNLSPSSITQFGLVKTIENLFLKGEKFYGIRFKFLFTGEKIQFNKVIETHIYRIIQELINNIIKHSGAKEAFIEINYHHPELKISVRDNGIGFQPKQISKGIGLNNIDSRIRFLNADFKKIEIEKGSWFIVDISLDKIVDL
ncbi:two-component sensor histidine kinase [Kaistella haifensis DSM 19056]|uniref:histidine kinase n=1 Tax=Kaistella haifensis DSM 19056 TaxID=1450526 RepID=A0A246BAQ3_9FLAO|nr:histidine kinase [Kaistella haifensis]OWK98731.1 two-component sensor histidine kinase [Kaistella haifensis DSM 19056]